MAPTAAPNPADPFPAGAPEPHRHVRPTVESARCRSIGTGEPPLTPAEEGVSRARV
jgi:hypothetical protein